MKGGDAAKRVAMLLGGCMFIYVAALGPLCAWERRNPAQAAKLQFLGACYHPLRVVARACPPIDWALTAYIDLWRMMFPAPLFLKY
jgi:hypothetical protein